MKLFATCCNDHVVNLFQCAVFEKCQYIKVNDYNLVIKQDIFKAIFII